LQDPFYELIDHPRKPGKKKKVKKQIPAYIPEGDAEVLARARKTAYRLDFCLFNFLGFRFGWSSVIGLIPAIGDALDMALAVALVNRMRKSPCGLPGFTLLCMAVNILVDFIVGLVPFVGDLADAYVKCNSRNVRLFEERLDELYKPELQRKEDAKKPKSKRPRPATVYEEFSDEEIDSLNSAINNSTANVQQPNRSYSPGRRERIPDEEMGIAQQNGRR
jgi:hypothetical protein